VRTWLRAISLLIVLAVIAMGRLSPWELTCWAAVGLVHIEVAARLPHRRTRLLLLGCGVVWLADGLARRSLPDGLILSAVRDPLLLHCVLTVGAGRLVGRIDRIFVLLGYVCWPLLIVGAMIARPGLSGLIAVRSEAYPVIGTALVALFALRMVRQPLAIWPAMIVNTVATTVFTFASGRAWLVVLFYLASAAVPLAVWFEAARTRSARTVLDARDSERRRIERDIHDGVQQRLVAASLLLQRARRAADSPELVHAGIAQLDLALTELRDLVHGMDPHILRRYGLVPAIESMIDGQAMPITLDSGPDDGTLPPDIAAAAYFVTAEAVANAAKHAGATPVAIRLLRQPGRLVVTIVDDGPGGARTVPGGGLAGLRDRVRIVGGELQVVSPDGGGTTIRATLPV
jgi:signal transduction histidine kinase